MIESLHITNTATYGQAPQALDRLAKFNFIFGTNGAGKTTITRVIAKPEDYPNCTIRWKRGTRLETLVYNRDFVESNFNSVEKLKGIFTLGERDISILDAINLKKGELASIVRSIEQLTNTLQGNDQKSGKQGELLELENYFKDKCWEQKQKYDESFKEAFAGVRSNSEKFKERVLRESTSNNAELKSLDYLKDRAKVVFEKNPVVESAIQWIGSHDILKAELNPILSKKIIGKEDVNISELIRRLSNSDWIKQGQNFYEQSKPQCPFCQQKVQDNFEVELSKYFDESFEKDTKAILDMQSTYVHDAEILINKLKAIVNSGSRFIDMNAFETELLAIEARLTTNQIILANKVKEPSLPVQLEPLTELLASASKLIADANEAIEINNEIARNIHKERSDLNQQVWKYILEVELKTEIAAYVVKKDGIKSAIYSLSRQIQELIVSRSNKESEIKELERSTTSIEPTISAINGLLLSFGFRNFFLDKADEGPFYKLVRENGSDAKNSLSEGERSFVTFLYFFHLLQGSMSDSGISIDRVVVFDDPVSSMDSEVLFIVSSLIKSLFDGIKNNVGQIKQIFVLTHNVYFHKEVTYTSDRAGGERSYWTVRKGSDGSVVKRHESNPVKTSYDLLWEELRHPHKNHLTVQNTMRRILENYFKVLGRMDFDKICDKFEGQEKILCRSLFSWINDGSHFSNDDAFYAFDEESIERYLEIFKQIFVKMEQQAHYDMMMASKSSN